VIHNGFLYHRDQVEGQSVSQLCVPKGRRDNVLRLAHKSVFGAHLGERKKQGAYSTFILLAWFT